MLAPPTFQVILGSLLDPFIALLDPGRRVYLPFLLGALALATLSHLRRRGLVERRSLRAWLFPRRLWLHPSALLDYRLIFVKALIRAALFPPLLVSTLSVSAAVAVWLHGALGPAPSLKASALAVGVLYTLCAFLLDDLSHYVLHRLMHRVPFLWELHKVHHSAEVLTPFTLYRTHPIESLLSALRGSLTIGAATGAFVWLFGQRVHGLEVLGVDAIGFLWSLLGANLRHSHVWLSYGPRIEHILISPAQHQIHHSDDPRHADRNFGTVLALWDWLGGSLHVTRGRESIRFGLSAGVAAHGPGVLSVLVRPVMASMRQLIAPARALLRPAMVALAALLLFGPGCTSKRVDRSALLRAFGECSLATYRAFETRAAALREATSRAADAPDPDSRAAARRAWEAAIDTWQQAESLEYGPAAAAPSPGAQGLRASIYAWPEVNRCLIEQQLVSRIHEGELFGGTLPGTRGLAAIEYLLFHEGADNACPESAAINAAGTWKALGVEEIGRRKAAYARAAAVDVAARASALVEAWQPGRGDFLTQLGSAGAGSTSFSTQQAAIEAVAEALFLLDTRIKDRKLAQPLGLKDCPAETCPEALESAWADRGASHLRNNLIGFGKLFLGCSADGAGLGFDDLLAGAGAEELARSMSQDLTAAMSAVDALAPLSLRQALVGDRARVQAIHEVVRRITGALKGGFSLALQVAPSRRVEGDQD